MKLAYQSSQYLYLYYVWALALLLGSCAGARDSSAHSHPPLLSFVPLDNPVVPCGDGSPAGVYYAPSIADDSNNRNHIIVVEGGDFCDNDDDCRQAQEKRPYRFSSAYFPTRIAGATVLSTDPDINPTLHQYHRWLVPYCSQDLFLGAGTATLAGFHRAGSLHILGVIDHILAHTDRVDRLVIVGASAGNLGIINHLAQFRELARERHAESLKVILDSSMFSDETTLNPDAVSTAFVDYALHPLCDPSFTATHPEVSKLPCCNSIHCHIRNGMLDAAGNASGTNTTAVAVAVPESFLFLDASYDPLAAFKIATEAADDAAAADDTTNALGGSDMLFEQVEIAGSRHHAVRDSLFVVLPPPPPASAPSVIWALPSCVSHPFLTTSSLFAALNCDDPPNLGHSEFYTCRDDFGTGTGVVSEGGLKLGVLNSARKWEVATVGDRTIQNLVGGFVDASLVPFDPPLDDSAAVLVLSDDCAGPNCSPPGSEESNACQAFVLVEYDYVGVPLGLQFPLALYIAVLILSFFFRYRFGNQKNRKSGAGSSTSKASPVDLPPPELASGIKMKNLAVFTKSGHPILLNIDLELKPGTVSGLLGRSGSGKSTVLGAISGQLPHGLVLSTEAELKVSPASTTVLRQNDNVSMENLTPSSYLSACAEVYGANALNLKQIISFVMPFFPVRVSEDDDDDDDDDEEKDNELLSDEPFKSTPIKFCSGGQRRVLAIGAALLTDPAVLLLDEPLSGLDSAASERLMELLTHVASSRGITVLMTMHQPSDDILCYLHDIIILQEGSLVFNEKVSSLNRALEMEGAENCRISDCVHGVVKNGMVGDSLRKILDQDSTERLPNGDAVANCPLYQLSSLPHRNRGLSDGDPSAPSVVSQVFTLTRRLLLEYGNNWTDLYTLPVCYTISTFVLAMRPRSGIQIVMSTLLFLFLPVLIYQHHNLLYLQMWKAHRTELDDRRISCLAYYISTFTFTTALPALSTLISYAIAFGIMGWSASAFLVAYLYAVFYLVLMLAIGRCLCLLFWGNHIYWKIFLLILFFNILFSGLLASPSDASEGTMWLFALSFTHWALSGSVLNIFENMDSLQESSCLDFLSCLVNNPSFIADVSGFAKLSNPLRAMVVLVGGCVFFCISEIYLLRSRRTHFVDPSSSMASPAKERADSNHLTEDIAISSQESASTEQRSV